MTEPRRTGIEAGLVGRVAAGVRYIVSGVTPTDWFGPMQPMAPVAPPDIAGRSFDFPVGANLPSAVGVHQEITKVMTMPAKARTASPVKGTTVMIRQEVKMPVRAAVSGLPKELLVLT